MYTTVDVQWDIHVQYGRHICSGEYANNVKCIPGFLVTSLTVMSSYKTYRLALLPHICT